MSSLGLGGREGGGHCAYARKPTITFFTCTSLPIRTVEMMRKFCPWWLYRMSSRIRCLIRPRERYRGRGFMHLLPHQSTGSRSRNIGMYTFNFILSSVSHISPNCSFRSSTNPLAVRGQVMSTPDNTGWSVLALDPSSILQQFPSPHPWFSRLHDFVARAPPADYAMPLPKHTQVFKVGISCAPLKKRPMVEI